MTLASRLRADLREIAAEVDPPVEAALRSVLARRGRPSPARAVAPRLLAAAASLVLVGGLVTWWLTARGGDVDVVVEPHPPSGTYETTLTGGLAGRWRLRIGDGRMSLVAPDATALGVRATVAPYDVRGRTLTTELLADRCGGPGTYTWADGPDLGLRVEDDDCDLRVRLLTDPTWSPVTGTLLAPGTLESPALTPARMRATALAAGFRPSDVDDYLTSTYPGAAEVTYTIQTEGGDWTVYDSADGAAPTVAWSGPYVVPDAATVVAGDPPCGPITYDYTVHGDTVGFVLVADPCTSPADVGELIAQTILYESAPFRRLG